MPESFKDSYKKLREKMDANPFDLSSFKMIIAEQREHLIAAWIAETGFLPSESILCAENTGLRMTCWVEKKYPQLPRDQYPEMDKLVKENAALKKRLDITLKALGTVEIEE